MSVISDLTFFSLYSCCLFSESIKGRYLDYLKVLSYKNKIQGQAQHFRNSGILPHTSAKKWNAWKTFLILFCPFNKEMLHSCNNGLNNTNGIITI